MSLWDDIAKLPVITDNGPLPASNELAGMLPRDFVKDPWGGLGFAAPFQGALIPRSEWKSIIDKKKRQRTRLIDMIADCNWVPDHQGRTNWCWANAVTMALELMDVIQRGSWERLSNASLAMPIVGGNYGGYVTEALRYAAKNGVATAKTWTPNTLAMSRDSTESAASRKQNKVDHWWDLQPRNFDQLVTCLLRDDPVPIACGFNWMRHAVCAVDVDYEGNEFIVTFANSGLYRDAKGYTRLSGTRAIPDSHLAPTLVTGE